MTPLSSRPRCWQRLAAPILFVVTFVLALMQLLRWVRHGEFFNPESPMLYSAATMSFNYIEFGAIRRGLFGTLVFLLHPNRMVGTALFYVLSAATFCALACWIFSRIRARPLSLLLFAALLVALVRRWGDDAGRSDLAILAILSGAALLAVHRRPALAAALMAGGVLAHETSVIYGVPLLVALLLDQRRYAELDRRQWLHVAIGAGLPLLVYVVLDLLPHADIATMVHTVRDALSEHKYVNWAIYFAVSGKRGVETALCQNRTDPNYLQHLLAALLIVLLFTFALAGRSRRLEGLALLASLPPLLVLSVVANDFTRWVEFAAYNAWLVCALGDGSPSGTDASRDRSLIGVRIAAALATVCLVTDFSRFPIRERFYAPSPIIEHIMVERLHEPVTPNLDVVWGRCDPDWLSFLNGLSQRRRDVQPTERPPS